MTGSTDRPRASGYGRGEGLQLAGPFFDGTPEQGWQLGMLPAETMRAAIVAGGREAGEFGGLMADEQGAFLTRLEEGSIDPGEAPHRRDDEQRR